MRYLNFSMFLWDCIKSKSSPEKKLLVIHGLEEISTKSSFGFICLFIRNIVCSDWPAIHCVVIGRIPRVCDGNVTPLPYCDAASRRDETKTIKPTINEAFVSFSQTYLLIIMTHTVFLCVALRKHNTMSAFVIAETPNKHYSTLLKTRITLNSQ